jgi:hypothetical protein
VPVAPILASAGAAALLLHPAIPGLVGSALRGTSLAFRKQAEYSAHFAVFCVLAALFATATRRRWRVTLLALIVAAAAAEAAQLWIPTRGVELRDAICNMAGVLAGTGLAMCRRPQTTIAAASSVEPDVCDGSQRSARFGESRGD